MVFSPVFKALQEPSHYGGLAPAQFEDMTIDFIPRSGCLIMAGRPISEICRELAVSADKSGDDDLSALLRMAALQAAESGARHYDGSVEDLLIGAWDWDVANDRLYADARFARIFGISAQDASDGPPQQQWVQSIHPDDRPAVNAAVDAALKGALFDQEYRVIAEGKTRWVYARGKCTMDRAGRAVRFAGAIVDISHEKLEEGVSIAPR